MKRKKLSCKNLGVMINLFVALFLLTICCSKESQSSEREEFNAIIGNWEWIKSVNAWTQNVTSPETEGYTMMVRFKTNDSVDYLTNGNLTKSYPYELKYRIKDNRNPNSDSTLVLVIANGTETFFSIDSDTLITSEAYVDGPTTYYKRAY
jgi:hypothetical protein